MVDPEDHLKLAYHVANQFRDTPLEPDERVACALLGLVKACRTFDPSRSVRFASYAVVVIRNEILVALRSHRRNAPVVTSLDAPVAVDGEGHEIRLRDTLGAEDDWIGAKEAEIDAGRAWGRLSDRERKAIRMAAQGVNQRQIARTLGISQTYCSRILGRARAKVARRMGVA